MHGSQPSICGTIAILIQFNRYQVQSSLHSSRFFGLE